MASHLSSAFNLCCCSLQSEGPSQSLSHLIIPSPGRYTYEIAPVFVLMEEEVLKKLRALVGWSSGDGVFCPGM